MSEYTNPRTSRSIDKMGNEMNGNTFYDAVSDGQICVGQIKVEPYLQVKNEVCQDDLTCDFSCKIDDIGPSCQQINVQNMPNYGVDCVNAMDARAESPPDQKQSDLVQNEQNVYSRNSAFDERPAHALLNNLVHVKDEPRTDRWIDSNYSYQANESVGEFGSSFAIGNGQKYIVNVKYEPTASEPYTCETTSIDMKFGKNTSDNTINIYCDGQQNKRLDHHKKHRTSLESSNIFKMEEPFQYKMTTSSSGCYEKANNRYEASKLTQKPQDRRKTYKCDTCGYSSKEYVRYMKHKKKDCGERHDCDICGDTFRGDLEFMKHKIVGCRRPRRMSSKDKDNKTRDDHSYDTKICSSSSTHDKDAGVQTMEFSSPLSEDEVLRCNLCEFTSVYFSDMKRHKRVHMGNEPFGVYVYFRCDVCEYMTTDSSALKHHKTAAHHGETLQSGDEFNISNLVASRSILK